ncbi:glycoside hydrolase family 5 protein [Candidatus Microthrix parvicella]|uniref:glycoside hydrolase family 5 protein n=1 Tax=Candidatus Neomicrothrix parvicella TaxID=41950 RepID=UPI0012FD5A78|nr:cellulase family glycosylhydrolase [Candidatus Microthrix parvicella]
MTAFLMLTAGATVATTGTASASASASASAGSTVADIVELLPLSTSKDRRIVDSQGRDMLLRGANVNSLGEYWQGVPKLDPTIPVSEADWERMAAHGFSVIRLLITWSRVEPTRGTIDQGYLDEVDAYVRSAAEHGMYSVIDMHQDAYSAFIFTTDPADCPDGTTPAKGWDGAPAWATLTDGLSTCLTNGERNSSPAVNRAWNHFYDNTDGIRDRFVATWGAVAKRFAGRSEVAGFDVLNEPENPKPAGELAPTYNEFLAETIGSIRAAQANAPFGQLILIEPALPAGDQSRGLVIPDPAAVNLDTTNVVASVHNYSESIENGFTIEGLNEVVDGLTTVIGVPNWGGEYGFWDTGPETLVKARRYATDEDRLAWGGAWWQWRQSCGDPHTLQWIDGKVVSPAGVEVHLNKQECPANIDLGPNDAFLDILGRGYPRATPGRITELRSDPDTGFLSMAATAPKPGGELVVWTPTTADSTHPVETRNLINVAETEVPGGRLITATVGSAGDYRLWVGPVDEAPAAPASPSGPAPTSGPSAPSAPPSGPASTPSAPTQSNTSATGRASVPLPPKFTG